MDQSRSSLRQVYLFVIAIAVLIMISGIAGGIFIHNRLKRIETQNKEVVDILSKMNKNTSNLGGVVSNISDGVLGENGAVPNLTDVISKLSEIDKALIERVKELEKQKKE